MYVRMYVRMYVCMSCTAVDNKPLHSDADCFCVGTTVSFTVWTVGMHSLLAQGDAFVRAHIRRSMISGDGVGACFVLTLDDL